MTKPADDLEAIRLVIQALEPFDSKDRERIVRWASEKLGMSPPTSPAPLQGTLPPAPPAGGVPPVATTSTPKDIKSFVLLKSPKSDNQLAAVVAYYYHFEAAPSDRKDFIGKEELIDACRKSDRKRPARPAQVLVNTYHAGLLDKAGEPGKYRLNAVGENLVAMVLPEQNHTTQGVSRKSKSTAGDHTNRGGSKKRAKSPKSK